MSRLSKAQIKLHHQAEELLKLDRLDDDQREFVLDNWQESARHVNSAAGAFFTPSGLARDLAYFAQREGGPIIDLCAGIGGLGLWCWWISGQRSPVTCVELNPDYVTVGRKIFPEATWICASVETALDLGRFTVAVSNPPFGKTAKIKGPRYSGEDDLAVIDIASQIAEYGTFILPQISCPFEYSGKRHYRERQSVKFDKFHKATGIILACESVDCAHYADDWRGVLPSVEMVGADFEGQVAETEQADSFGSLAA